MSVVRFVFKSIPYLWIALNIYGFYLSNKVNEYDLFGSEQSRMFEHISTVYPFHSTNIAFYDISEFLFYCIIPVYLYIVISKLIISILAK